jgi:hypothetical protein
VPGFATSHLANSSIDVFYDAEDSSIDPSVPHPATISPNDVALIDTATDSDRPTRVCGAPYRFGYYVAHVPTVPRVCVDH